MGRPAPGGLVLVHGGPGSGKTELAAHVRAWAMEHDLTVLSGRGRNPWRILEENLRISVEFSSKKEDILRKFCRKIPSEKVLN